jgi:hypothetical protein
MMRPLDRLLRLRRSIENLAFLELEKRKAEAHRLEQGAEQQRRLALATRSGALALLERGGAEMQTDWLLHVADAEILSWKRARLAAQAMARRPGIEAARREMLARRLERRQVGMLAAAAASALEKEQIRREQNQADDWFQSRAVRGLPDRVHRP